MSSSRVHQRVVYISYDGAAEPLGQSQVVPYLERLAESFDITLISFEKPGPRNPHVASRLTDSGVHWLPLAYHRRPPVASTWGDVVRGVRALDREAARQPVDIVHARSYVPALIACRSRVVPPAKLLFDIRGFWADERVEGGIWRRGPLYRRAKAYERRFFRAADAIVTLTEASLPHVRTLTGHIDVPMRVIPTCVDVDRYRNSNPRPDGPHAVWNGSIGTWYRFDLGIRMAGALGLPFTVLTRDPKLAESALGGQPAQVRSLDPPDVAQALGEGDIGLCLIRESFSKIASAPTRVAEHLAAGNPVAVTDVGDLAPMVTQNRVGAVIKDTGDASLKDAATVLRQLAADPAAIARCRAVARSRFDVGEGVARYRDLYNLLGAARAGGTRVD